VAGVAGLSETGIVVACAIGLTAGNVAHAKLAVTDIAVQTGLASGVAGRAGLTAAGGVGLLGAGVAGRAGLTAAGVAALVGAHGKRHHTAPVPAVVCERDCHPDADQSLEAFRLILISRSKQRIVSPSQKDQPLLGALDDLISLRIGRRALAHALRVTHKLNPNPFVQDGQQVGAADHVVRSSVQYRNRPRDSRVRNTDISKRHAAQRPRDAQHHLVGGRTPVLTQLQRKGSRGVPDVSNGF